MIEHTASTGGFLYALQQDGLVLQAQTGPHAPLKNMDELASTYLAAELDEADDITATDSGETSLSTLWTAHEGRFIPLLMAHTGEQGRVITGLALLYVPGEHDYSQPGALVPALSRALADGGEVRTAIVPL